MQAFVQNLPQHAIVCREGDPSMDLFLLQSGKLLVCTVVGKEVKALNRIVPGQFFGELSFFDGHTRSGTIITLEESTLIQIPRTEIHHQLPAWYSMICSSVTKRIRLLDQVIQEAKIRHSEAEEMKPLSIEEQRLYYNIITHQDT
jgi:CRP/FNR family transcriptional regulator, cyclic AMP receptor protein